jgi:hypothetical protein
LGISTDAPVLGLDVVMAGLDEAFRVEDRGVRETGRRRLFVLVAPVVDVPDAVFAAGCFDAVFLGAVFVVAAFLGAVLPAAVFFGAVFFAAVLLAAGFFAAVFFAAGFFAAVLLAAGFFAAVLPGAVFFAAVLLAAVFFAAVLFGAAFFAAASLAVVFCFATATIRVPPGECERRTLPPPFPIVRVLLPKWADVSAD